MATCVTSYADNISKYYRPGKAGYGRLMLMTVMKLHQIGTIRISHENRSP